MAEVEIWKDVPGYEGLYQVSSLGKVKSLQKHVKMPNGGVFIRKESIMKQRITKYGYADVSLCLSSKKRNFFVHRLVALAHLDNSEFKPEVNHKNGSKIDNRAVNLEWSTPSENVNHSLSVLGVKRSKGDNHHKSRPINLYDHNGNFIGSYGSMVEVSRIVGVSLATLSRIANGKQKNTVNYTFKFS